MDLSALYPVLLIILLCAGLALFFVSTGLVTRYYQRKGEQILRDFLIDFDRKKLQMENLAGNEATGQIIKSTPARHLYTAKLKTFNAVSGNLYLTPQRLFFLPHPLAFVTYEVTISIDSIRQVEPFSTKLLASPGIVVHLRDGKVEKFLLKERDLWVNQLSELMQ